MKKVCILLCAVLLVLAGCDMLGLKEKEETGSIMFSISPFAPWLMMKTAGSESRGLDGTEESKAWMLATSVKLDLYSGTSIVRTWTFNSSSPGWGTGTGTVGTSTQSGIPVGTYTKLVASVFNSYTSTTTPVVTGEVTNVTVNVSATTNLTITCFPVSPASLSEGSYSSAFSLVQYAEKWFTASTSTGSTKFYCKSNSGDTDIYVFKPDGTLLGASYATTTEEYVTLDTPSNPYYIVAVAVAGGNAQVKFIANTPDTGTIGVTVK